MYSRGLGHVAAIEQKDLKLIDDTKDASYAACCALLKVARAVARSEEIEWGEPENPYSIQGQVGRFTCTCNCIWADVLWRTLDYCKQTIAPALDVPQASDAKQRAAAIETVGLLAAVYKNIELYWKDIPEPLRKTHWRDLWVFIQIQRIKTLCLFAIHMQKQPDEAAQMYSKNRASALFAEAALMIMKEDKKKDNAMVPKLQRLALRCALLERDRRGEPDHATTASWFQLYGAFFERESQTDPELRDAHARLASLKPKQSALLVSPDDQLMDEVTLDQRMEDFLKQAKAQYKEPLFVTGKSPL